MIIWQVNLTNQKRLYNGGILHQPTAEERLSHIRKGTKTDLHYQNALFFKTDLICYLFQRKHKKDESNSIELSRWLIKPIAILTRIGAILFEYSLSFIQLATNHKILF